MRRTPNARFPFDIFSFHLYGTSGKLTTFNKGHTCVL